mmetsp:Transcript_41698/g.131035  ORF Transcript_41698/g.131035 Transcript_41698/m.131035 type:complete len:226 (+) Transcript_41698:864-1541(+)
MSPRRYRCCRRRRGAAAHGRARRRRRCACLARGAWRSSSPSFGTRASTSRTSSTPLATASSTAGRSALSSPPSTSPRCSAPRSPDGRSTPPPRRRPGRCASWPPSASPPPPPTRSPSPSRCLRRARTGQLAPPLASTSGRKALRSHRSPSSCGASPTRRSRRTCIGSCGSCTRAATSSRAPWVSTRWCSRSAGRWAFCSCRAGVYPPSCRTSPPRRAALSGSRSH